MSRSGRWYGNEPVNPNLAETVYTFVATNNQSTFGPVLYLPPYIDIFIDGVKLSRQNDIVMGTGSPCATTVDVSASIAESISEGSIVEIVTKVPTKLLDALTQAIADTLYQKQNLPSSVIPTVNGQLVLEATSNTQITVKYKGSDGTVRSTVLTLS